MASLYIFKHDSDAHLSEKTGLFHCVVGRKPLTLLKVLTELLGPQETWEKCGIPVQSETRRESFGHVEK